MARRPDEIIKLIVQLIAAREGQSEPDLRIYHFCTPHTIIQIMTRILIFWSVFQLNEWVSSALRSAKFVKKELNKQSREELWIIISCVHREPHVRHNKRVRYQTARIHRQRLSAVVCMQQLWRGIESVAHIHRGKTKQRRDYEAGPERRGKYQHVLYTSELLYNSYTSPLLRWCALCDTVVLGREEKNYMFGFSVKFKFR